MNGYIQEFLKEMAGQAATVQIMAAHAHSQTYSAYVECYVEPMRLHSIGWQLEHELECIDYEFSTPQQERKLS